MKKRREAVGGAKARETMLRVKTHFFIKDFVKKKRESSFESKS